MGPAHHRNERPWGFLSVRCSEGPSCPVRPTNWSQGAGRSQITTPLCGRFWGSMQPMFLPGPNEPVAEAHPRTIVFERNVIARASPNCGNAGRPRFCVRRGMGNACGSRRHRDRHRFRAIAWEQARRSFPQMRPPALRAARTEASRPSQPPNRSGPPAPRAPLQGVRIGRFNPENPRVSDVANGFFSGATGRQKVRAPPFPSEVESTAVSLAWKGPPPEISSQSFHGSRKLSDSASCCVGRRPRSWGALRWSRRTKDNWPVGRLFRHVRPAFPMTGSWWRRTPVGHVWNVGAGKVDH